jgi:hypothetical protein
MRRIKRKCSLLSMRRMKMIREGVTEKAYSIDGTPSISHLCV